MRESGARRAGVAPRRRRTPRGPSLEAGRAARGHGRPRHGRRTGDRGATVISGGGGGGQALAPPHPARPRATARRRRRPIGPPADPPMEPFPLMRCDPRFPSSRWRARGRRRGCHFAQPRRKDAYSTGTCAFWWRPRPRAAADVRTRCHEEPLVQQQHTCTLHSAWKRGASRGTWPPQVQASVRVPTDTAWTRGGGKEHLKRAFWQPSTQG